MLHRSGKSRALVLHLYCCGGVFSGCGTPVLTFKKCAQLPKNMRNPGKNLRNPAKNLLKTVKNALKTRFKCYKIINNYAKVLTDPVFDPRKPLQSLIP